MKINLKLNLAALAGILLFGTIGCSDLSELNVDPNNPVEVPASNLVVQAQYELNDRLHSRNYNAEWTMLVTQHWSQNEYAEESRFVVDGNTFDNAWQDLYANVLNELKVAREIINENEGLAASIKANQLAVISVLEAYTYHALVDGYGAVPFSQALQPDEFTLPAYDSQPDIYAGIVSKLQDAISSMDAGSDSFGEPIYNGDVASWKRFANSLLMRVAMRMSNVDEATARGVIGGITGDLITNNSQNALWVFDANPGIANPLFIDNVIDTRDDFAVSDVLINTLIDANDPRLTVYADTTISGDYVGMPSGLTDADAFALKPNTSRPAPGVRAATAPAVMMDAAEVHFMLAEAYQRGLLDGDAAAAYDAGVTASMEYWGFSDEEGAITDYLAANAYDAGDWKKSVGVQKWLAFYMNGPQAWAEWRRLDQPELVLPAAAVNDVIPVRLPYPVSEQTRNSTELGKVTGTPNDLSTKLWWDVN